MGLFLALKAYLMEFLQKVLEELKNEFPNRVVNMYTHFFYIGKMNFWWISEAYKIAKETTLKKSLKKKKKILGCF